MSESISDGGPMHAAIAFPHPGGCWGCQKALTCNVCGRATSLMAGRCTNGRCGDCHRSVCTPGGSHSGDGPGHGYGSRAAAVAAKVAAESRRSA